MSQLPIDKPEKVKYFHQKKLQKVEKSILDTF